MRGNLLRLALLTSLLATVGAPTLWEQAIAATPGIALPGRVEAERYRAGGPGVGYHDLSEGNTFGMYRDDDVDIRSCADPLSPSGCFYVGAVQAGEWLSYDVKVATAANFILVVRYATPVDGRWIRVEIDGHTLVKRLDLPISASNTAWAIVKSSPVAIAAGRHVVRVIASTGNMKLNFFRFAPTSLSADPILAGAGDIARCGKDADEATAALLDTLPGTVITMGDNAYPNGSETDFADCYGPSWGRHKARTRPAVGNHEFLTPGAAPYFQYFGSAAGTPGQGWYSYDVGAWHVVVLNSNCSKNGGCGPEDPQSLWLAADLAAHPTDCTLAYWHHPRWSSGVYGNDANMQTYWDILDAAGADLILNAHALMYERFAPMDASGTPDAAGMRQIVVGTGGGSVAGVVTVHPQSEVRNSDTFGVIKLTLSVDSFDWEFIPIAGDTFTDAGTGSCS